jgi:hypothetical protein
MIHVNPANKEARLLGLAAMSAAGLFGILVGHIMAPQSVPAAYAAACQTHFWNCGADTTLTAVNTVYHQHLNGTPNVEPNSGEDWDITAYWNTAGAGSCFEITETADVDVDWNGGAVNFQLSNINTTTHINTISICTLGICAVGDGGYAYRLFVDVDEAFTVATKTYNLRQVVFSTTSVDNGNEISTVDCSDSTAVTPDSQVWTATHDWNTGGGAGFPCVYNCAQVGAITTITYQ